MKKKTIIAATCCLLLLIIATVCLITSCGQTKKEEKNKSDAVETVSPTKSQNERVLNVEKEPVLKKNGIRRLQVIKEGQVRYDLNYIPKEDRESYLFWELSEPYKDIATVDTEQIYKLFEKISKLNINNQTLTETKADTGIETSNTNIMVEYTNDIKEMSAQNTVTLIIGNMANDNEYYCVRKGTEKEIFLVNRLLIDSLLTTDPYSLILKVPFLIKVNTVKEVSIKYESTTHTMNLDDGIYKLDKKKVDKKNYCDLFAELMSLTVEKEIPETDKGRDNKSTELSLTFKRNMDQAEDYNVNIQNYDNEYDSVKVNDSEFFLVSKIEVEQLINYMKDTFK